MKVNIQAVNFNADQKLISFIQNRLNKLDRYYDKVIDADVYLKLDNNNGRENKLFEVRLNVPGDKFVVKKQSKTFEEGTDLAIGSLERQLKKRKEKIRAHI